MSENNNTSTNLMQAIKDENIVQSIQLEDLILDTSEETTPSKTIKDYLNAPMGDEKDAQFKKLIAIAIIIAKQNKRLPENMPESPENIAEYVDDSLNRLKNAYQTGAGRLDPVEAIDQLIDATTALTVVMIDKAFETGMANRALTKGAIVFLTCLKVPNAQAYEPTISNVIKKVEKPIQEFTKKGINFIAQSAKAAVHKVASTIKEYFKQTIINTVR